MSDVADQPLKCKICDTLWQSFHLPANHGNLRFSYMDALHYSECTAHRPLIKALAKSCEYHDDGEFAATKLIREVESTFYLSYAGRESPSDRNSTSLWMSDIQGISWGRIPRAKRTWKLSLIHKVDVPSHPGLGRVIDPDWMDVNLARSWKEKCLRLHGAKCQNPLKIWKAEPAWMVDTQKYCIVHATGIEDYVALSYRWGNTQPIMKTSETMARFMKQDALKSPTLVELAPMIRDAIEFTRSLGERYLWVDALCIDHSNREETGHQLEQMGSIYANAMLVLIAADADAQMGLPGLRNVSGSREQLKPGQLLIPWGKETLSVFYGWQMDEPSTWGPYSKRGWTFQEYRLAQRRIVIDGHGMHWQCTCATWHEDLVQDAVLDAERWLEDDGLTLGFPHLKTLDAYLIEYNRRSFTYEEDALPGVSGLLAVMSRMFHGGFLYGLPVATFDRALCWTPFAGRRWGDAGPWPRRRISSNRTSLLPSNSSLPSWSWVGWAGNAGCDAGDDLMLSFVHSVWETSPVTIWYAGRSPTTPKSERIMIESTWYSVRDSYKDLSRPPPPGWKLAKNDGQAPVPLDEWREEYFEHEILPGHLFYYPFPIQKIEQSTRPSQMEQLPYLFCETQKARLWGFIADEDREDCMITLWNADTTAVGELNLHNPDELLLFPSEGKALVDLKAVDLVAICQAREHDVTRDYDTDEMVSTSKTDWIRVLWVEEENCVSYRRAVGKVKKEFWDKLELKNISLVLG